MTGKDETYTIVREWAKVVAGTIKYYWLHGNAGDEYSMSVLHLLDEEGPTILSLTNSLIDPNDNSSRKTRFESFGLDRYVIIIPKQEDLDLVAKHTP